MSPNTLTFARSLIIAFTLLAITASEQAYRMVDQIGRNAEQERSMAEIQARSQVFWYWLEEQVTAGRHLARYCWASGAPPAPDCQASSSPLSNRIRYAYVLADSHSATLPQSQYPSGLMTPGPVSDPDFQRAIRHSLGKQQAMWYQHLQDRRAIYHLQPLDAQSLVLGRFELKQLAQQLGNSQNNQFSARLAVATGSDGEWRFVLGEPETTLAERTRFSWQSKAGAGSWQIYWHHHTASGATHVPAARFIRVGGLAFALITLLCAWFALNTLQRSQRQAADLKALTDELADSERNYRLLVEQIPGAVFRSKPGDEGHQLLLASPGISLLTGCPERDFLPSGNRRYMDLVHPADRERLADTVRRHRERESTYEIEYRLKSGKDQWLWVLECAQSREHPSGAILIDGIVFDITARKLAQHALQESEGILHAIIDHTPNIAIQGYTIDGRVVFWNQASQLLYGWSEQEAVGKRIDELIISSREMLDFLTQLEWVGSHNRAIEPMELKLNCKNGERRWMLTTIFPVGHYRGEEVFVCMHVDIDARKKMETELRSIQHILENEVSESRTELESANVELGQALKLLMHAEKLAALGSLVAGLAHELNTPLGNTLTVATTLRDNVQELNRQQEDGTLRKSALQQFIGFSVEAADLIERNARRASELIAHFKSVATDTTSDRRREFDLGLTITEVLTTLSPQLKHQPHTVEVAIPDGLLLDSYPGALEQIVTNLIQNSLKHAFGAGQAGHIRISASRLELPQPTIRLDYQDDGSGIPPELQTRVFEAFFTTKLAEGGSGLGLYIVRNLTESVLGGTLNLISNPDSGTRFILDLPEHAPRTRKEQE
ncbi:PAS domain-containing sensor histidine kinase [Chitinilyticum litopenaei]|uniref:PAS domain-containing sensor histidine kinase n=1 Tax=Chitinilyticum litopenaei TaxID=1121276 RepID=UPI0003F586D3|nr:PAS domain-containing sensor histidine kinase [Chitinilyticum litopenaei]